MTTEFTPNFPGVPVDRTGLEVSRYLYASPTSAWAVLVSLTKVGEIEPSWQADDRQWTMEDFDRTGTHRVSTKQTAEGYFTDPLKADPGAINIPLQYAPMGWKGQRFALPKRAWYEPLVSLDRHRGINLHIRIGGLNYGIWILQSCAYKHKNLIKIRTGREISIVPRLIQCDLTFVSVQENIHVATELTDFF